MPTPTPPPVPEDIRSILNAVYQFARTQDLGVISTVAKNSGTPRFVLAGRVTQPDGSHFMLPLGYLRLGIANEVADPSEVSPVVTFEVDPSADAPKLDDFTATMIAEGEMEADEDLTLRAWQYLEDTGLGYRLQGWFGRRLRDLIEAGDIRPRKTED